MYLVAGLGATGQSVLNYFKTQGERCLAFDTREDFDLSDLKNVHPEMEFATGDIPNNWNNRFETIVLSPGISKQEPWVKALRKLGKEVIGDIELFARAVGQPVIAITGSNGKSTVTTITGMVLEEAGYSVGVGGNIGEPALNLLIDDNEYDVYVLELSSFQLETTYSLTSVSSTILNISEDHMDRYLGIEDYIKAKTKVFAQTDLAVIPEGLSDNGLIVHESLVHFSNAENFIKSDDDYGVLIKDGQRWLGHGQDAQVKVSEMKLQGRHHELNALAMLALCRPFNVDNQCFEKVLQDFTGLPHRTELVMLHNGVTWVNDSKGTNVGATITAIQSLGEQTEGQLVLIAGGVGKDADFAELAAPVNRYCKKVILFGRDQAIMYHALAENEGLQIERVPDLSMAVGLALESAQENDSVLFSPACASFDQFQNYVQRGEVFSQLVEQACGLS